VAGVCPCESEGETGAGKLRLESLKTLSSEHAERLWKEALLAKKCSKIIAPIIIVLSAFHGFTTAQVATFPLKSADGLELVHAKADAAMYRGHSAVRVSSAPGPESGDDSMLAVLTASSFKDGVIEAEVAGFPRPGAPSDARGFIGIAFRVQPDHSHYECFYIRPTNGRSDDQLRRNHTTQYVSEPDYPWFRLRKENPGVYESYVDLQSGEWTKLKIVVSGTSARLYVNGAEQPTLIVNDLKLGEAQGRVALWADPSTDAYFSDLRIR
jgi:hypothetical protein